MTFRLIHLAAAAPTLAALAAALPAAAQESSTPLWTGWYVGGNLGADWGDNDLKARVSPGTGALVIPPADLNQINVNNGGGSNKTGFTGGIEGGYNYQSGNWLFGLETDFVALDVNQHTNNVFRSAVPTSPFSYSLNQRAKTSWMWSLRPRIGYVSGPWLIYGTGGIATSDIKVSMNFSDNRIPPNAVGASKSTTKTGWIAGAGVGYRIAPNWSAKGEWLYADFGSVRATATGPTGFVDLTSQAKVRANILRVGVDYHF